MFSSNRFRTGWPGHVQRLFAWSALPHALAQCDRTARKLREPAGRIQARVQKSIDFMIKHYSRKAHPTDEASICDRVELEREFPEWLEWYVGAMLDTEEESIECLNVAIDADNESRKARQRKMRPVAAEDIPHLKRLPMEFCVEQFLRDQGAVKKWPNIAIIAHVVRTWLDPLLFVNGMRMECESSLLRHAGAVVCRTAVMVAPQ
jgi:hypothetical protein